jgi:hypothetical protein
VRARLLTLLALASCWPAWVATGWIAEALQPAGPELLLRAGLMLPLLALLGRLLDRLDARRIHDGHG